MRPCWTPTKESYFDRVPKALMLDAVHEDAGAEAAKRIAGFKKDCMITEAERLLDGTGWLPSFLRGSAPTYPMEAGDSDPETLPL